MSNPLSFPAVVRVIALVSSVSLLSTPSDASTAVAKVGNTSISRAALDQSVNQSISSTYFHQSMPSSTRLTVSKERLQELIRRELASLAARDAGLRDFVDEATSQCREIEKQLGPAEYAESLKLNGWTRKQHVRELSKTLAAAEAYRRFVTVPSVVSDAELRATYEAEPSRWTMPASARVQHILIRPSGTSEKAFDEAATTAKAITERARAGEDFGKLAGELSADDYRIRGGDLGLVHKGRLVPEVDAAVFAMPTGVASDPIRSAEGWHIVVVNERHEARQLSFAEAAPRIREVVEKERVSSTEAAWFASLKKKYPVVILDPELAGR